MLPWQHCSYEMNIEFNCLSLCVLRTGYKCRSADSNNNEDVSLCEEVHHDLIKLYTKQNVFPIKGLFSKVCLLCTVVVLESITRRWYSCCWCCLLVRRPFHRRDFRKPTHLPQDSSPPTPSPKILAAFTFPRIPTTYTHTPSQHLITHNAHSSALRSHPLISSFRYAITLSLSSWNLLSLRGCKRASSKGGAF